MPISALHHIVLSVSDLDRSRTFYVDVLGFELRSLPKDFPGVFAGSHFFMVGGVEIFLVAHQQTPAGDRFSEFRLGLDHLSFTATSEADLRSLAEKLKEAGVPTNGVEVFAPANKKYVSFRDPDNIQLEYWLE